MAFEVSYKDEALERLEKDAQFSGGYSAAIVKAFRKRMWAIRNASDERDFYGMSSARFERLQGKRSHQYSMRLNDQWRLIIELHGSGEDKKLLVVGIEDYH